MGPRSEERGDGKETVTPRPEFFASMGPRSEERGDAADGTLTRIGDPLQWGRAPRSAESSIDAGDLGGPENASMGPRSEERGESATASPKFRNTELQWGRAPRSAERVRRRAGRRCRGCFNGAALRGARRASAFFLGLTDEGRASMGPRSEERGEGGLEDQRVPAQLASMGPRSEERGEAAGLCGSGNSARIGFNGAALRGARREACSRPRGADRTGLQWGRAPRSAESHSRCSTTSPQRSFNGAALRGARRGKGEVAVRLLLAALQWGRAPRSAERIAAATMARTRRRGFNGAALRGARRVSRAAPCRRAGLASMGPRSEERGESCRG